MAFPKTFMFIIIFLVSTLTLASEVKPIFNESGPQANSRFCASKGYPVSWKYSKDPCYRVGSFTNFDELSPTNPVKTNEPVWQLSYANKTEVDPDLNKLADDVLKGHPITSIIIWQDGKIHKEVYQYGRKDTDLFSSFSMHKTLTGLVIGAATQRGLINDIDDPVTKYLPSLSQTDWKDKSVFHALTMTSGMASYQRELLLPLMFKDADRLSQIKIVSKNAISLAGEKFIYSDTNSYVLGLIAEQVFDASQGDIISEVLWQSIGAESDAQIHTTKSGQHLLSASLRARPRDYLRIGLLIANDGQNHLGQQIISKTWINSLYGETDRLKDCPMGKNCREFAYSYQTWLPPIPQTIAAIGKYGQYIFVAKKTNTVIVITSADKPEGLHKKPLIMKLVSRLASK